MMFGIVLHDSGWRISYLGANTPVEELARAAEVSRPELVVLAATGPGILEPLRPELASLARRAPLALAGAGATPQNARAVGARLMAGDPVTEAETGRVAAVKVLVAGASGFVGRRLCPALAGAGHDVVAMTRNPAGYTGAGTPVHGDVHDPHTLDTALAGCEAAYYLVHSLSDADFERKDAAAATAFGQAAARAGLQRIIYLGGLGDDKDALSAHLRSRREVEKLLGSAGVPVTVIRAGIIIGHGGISWELTRQLVEHLPAMITPRWVATRTQPIAVDDVVRYLVGVLALPEAAGRVFEVGGPEVLQYVTMLRRVAAIEGRPLPILPVPLLTPRLSSLWLTLVTDVDTATGRALVDSMTNEVIVRDQSIRDLIPFEPCPTTTPCARRSANAARPRRRPVTAGAPGPAAGTQRTRAAPGPRAPPGQIPPAHTEPAAARARAGGSSPPPASAARACWGSRYPPKPGSPQFYLLTMGLAGTWAAGALSSGPLPLGTAQGRRRPAPPRGHARAHRRRRLRAVLRRRPARPAHPPAQPGHRQRPALRGRRVNPARAAHRVRQRGGRGTVLPRRPLVARRGVAPPRQDHARLRRHHRRDPQPRARAGGDRHQRDLRPPAPHLRRGPGPGARPSHLVAPHAALPPAPVPDTPRPDITCE